MSYRTLTLASAALALTVFLPSAARAQVGPLGMLTQTPTAGTVAGTGTVMLKQPPTVIRMYIELLGKGSTLGESLESLKDRREAAAIQLEALGADKDSITFGTPSLSNSQSEQKKQFEQMILQRMSSRGKTLPKGLVVPKSVTVSATLSVEWPLEAEDGEGRLLAAEALKEKVKAADIAGVKDAEKLSPEEEELAAEMAGMVNDYGEKKVPVGEPQFVYVARISEDDGTRAMADAFAKAKAQATRLAQAAGRPLGSLVGLAGQSGGMNNQMAQRYGSYGYAQQNYMQRLMGGGLNSSPKQREAVGASADVLIFNFSIHANFRLQEPSTPLSGK